MKRFFNQLIPFILFGVAIVAFVFGVMLLSYLFLFGALLGFILYTIKWLHDKFFSKKTVIKTQPKPKSGRIIDTDDWRELK